MLPLTVRSKSAGTRAGHSQLVANSSANYSDGGGDWLPSHVRIILRSSSDRALTFYGQVKLTVRIHRPTLSRTKNLSHKCLGMICNAARWRRKEVLGAKFIWGDQTAEALHKANHLSTFHRCRYGLPI